MVGMDKRMLKFAQKKNSNVNKNPYNYDTMR